ncbi:hypothetical protein EZY14_007440 [Kordia sp. TARA_039_SRF]|nr:hypothetical protein EZY14_007440 [Kordia sp. TARA_039_SRF]
MKIKKIEERIQYIPNTYEGRTLFNGYPHVSKRVLDIIGQEGVDHIDKTLKTFLEYRKEMYGDANKYAFGFESQQYFFDLQEQILLKVKSITEVDQGKPEDYSISLADLNDRVDSRLDRGIKRQKSKKSQISHIKSGLEYNNFRL